MATYYSDRTSSNGSHAIKGGFGMIFDTCEITIGTALVNNDIIKLFTLPKGSRVFGLIISAASIQSGNDSTYDVGDSGDQDRFLASDTELRNTTVYSYPLLSPSSKTTSTSMFHTYTANTDIEMKITTAGTGMTTGGKIVASIMYFLE